MRNTNRVAIPAQAGSRLRASLVLAFAGSLTSACATTSFAPPPVNMSRAVVAAPGSGCVKEAQPAIDLQAQRDIDSASRLVDNFLLAYRCAQREAADGRQIFEIPSILSLAGAALGPTFGMAENGPLGLAAYAALLGQGRSYYAPKDKAAMLNFAIDAVLCVKTESVDVSFYDTTPSPTTRELFEARLEMVELQEEALQSRQRLAEFDARIGAAEQAPAESAARASLGSLGVQRDRERRQAGFLAEAIGLQQERIEYLEGLRASGQDLRIERPFGDGGTVVIDVPRKYFETVAGALFSIERVLADRLDDAGKQFDASGVSAEFEQVLTRQNELKTKKDGVENQLLGLTEDDRAAAAALREKLIEIELDELQPKLQACVLRAKMS